MKCSFCSSPASTFLSDNSRRVNRTRISLSKNLWQCVLEFFIVFNIRISLDSMKSDLTRFATSDGKIFFEFVTLGEGPGGRGF